MQPFRVFEGLAAALDLEDVDTDQIIPKQFLKRTGRDGYGEACFFDWRYDPQGSERPEFELNDPAYQGASVLVTGRNFGCGSSREHAVWALAQMGFRAVLAPSFADIFCTNALQNGLLPVALAEADCSDFHRRARQRDGYRLTVDLATQEVRDREGRSARFQVDPFWKECLLAGLDPLGMALREAAAVSDFERARSPLLPTTRHRWE